MLTIDQIKDLVFQQAFKARQEAERIELSDRLREKVAKANARAMITDLPAFSSSKLAIGSAVKVPSATVLFVDMRSSTRRAYTLGAAKTYITMHSLLPALAHIVAEQNGYIVGFRGDGLFAVFGIDREGKPSTGAKAVGTACQAGCYMVQAVEKAVNPVLDDFGIPGDVKIGVGVDAGEIVITKIGLHGMWEITAYGDAVNRAAKLCTKGIGEVIVSTDAQNNIGTSKNGKLRFSKYVFFDDGDLSGQVVESDASLPGITSLRG